MVDAAGAIKQAESGVEMKMNELTIFHESDPRSPTAKGKPFF